MRLATDALANLTGQLRAAVASMGIDQGSFGKVDMVKAVAKEAEALFQGYAKAKPSKADAYAAALALMRGQALDAWQRDLVASALAEPVKEQSGAVVLGSKHFPALLAGYEDELRRGELWRLTWHGLVYSYFNYDPVQSKDAGAEAGWSELRAFLERTWPAINRQAGQDAVPEWVTVLRAESAVLTVNPVGRYAKAYLAGDTSATDSLALGLGIPPSSWFWHALTLGVVKQAAAASDAEFRQLIPRLIELAQSTPVFRDDAVEVILTRYHACNGAPQDEQLRDYVCLPTVWKNPKLKAAGMATAWNRVPDGVWHMVLRWVNERNLKDFFDILAARNKADEGRLEFWSRYMKQITWTRLVFGADTMALKRSNAEVRNLIAREEGAYAQLTGRREVDAFMMQIGPYVVIEFSKKPNACYVYKPEQLPFDRYGRHYDGGTEDLAAGFHVGSAARIVHTPGWQPRAERELQSLGIRPDALGAQVGVVRAVRNAPPASSAPLPLAPSVPTPQPTPAATWKSPVAAPVAQPKQAAQRGPNMATLEAVISTFPGARIDDRRRLASGGRLWVEDPSHNVKLADELRHLGFKWANSRLAWYFPEQ
jgi:hypothetical protein